MPLTIDQLRSGISYWRSSTGWPPDFHNHYYVHDLAPRLVGVRANGIFNQQWWNRFLPVLQDWQAVRPCSHAFLTSRAQARLESLTANWAATVAPHYADDISGVEWHQLAAFPSLVGEIKDVSSPVFTAKFCHCLAPRIFPVVDNQAVGNPFPTYEAYFRAARTEWLSTDSATQDELIRLLTNEVRAPLFEGFPIKAKLIELCMIGRRHG